MAEQSSVGGLLGAIINPAQVNVLGAVDAGKKRRGKDLAGKILGGTFTGRIGAGMMANLAETDYDQFIKVQNVMMDKLGIADDKGRQAKHIGDVAAASHLIDKGLVDEGMQILRDGADSVDAVLGSTTETKNVRRMLEMYDRGGEGREKALQGVKALASVYTAQPSAKEQAQTADLESKTRERDAPKVVSALDEAKTQQALAAAEKSRADVLSGPKKGKPSEQQLASAGFANRVQASNTILNKLSDGGFSPISKMEIAKGASNVTATNEFQSHEQAKADFITAVLRKESGAVISDSEFDREEKKFFPRFGDGEKVVKQKRAARLRAFDNLKAQSLGQFDELFGLPTGLTDNGDGTFTTADGKILQRKKKGA